MKVIKPLTVAKETPAREIIGRIGRSAREHHATAEILGAGMLVGAEEVELFALRHRGGSEDEMTFLGEFGEGKFRLLDLPLLRRVERIRFEEDRNVHREMSVELRVR